MTTWETLRLVGLLIVLGYYSLRLATGPKGVPASRKDIRNLLIVILVVNLLTQLY